MPQRITTISVVVYRDGKRQNLKPNTKFDFTADEIAQINGVHKGALRKPESLQDDVVDLTGGDKKPEAPKKEEVKTDEKPLTAAQKKKQAEAEAKAKLAEEQGNTADDEGSL